MKERLETADLIVVGAGVLGTFHAYFAAERGMRVLLLERNMWPSDSSTRNFGMAPRTIVPSHGQWAGFVRDSREIYRSIQAEHDISVSVKGCLYLASNELERAVLHEYPRCEPADGGEFLDRDELAWRYPWVGENCCAGLLFAEDLALEPDRLLRQLIPFVTQRTSVEYLPNSQVLSVETTGSSCLVRTAGGRAYAAERVIICTGAECRTLFPNVLQASGLQICKVQMMRTIPQAGFSLPHSVLSGLSIRRYPAFSICPSYQTLLQQPVAPQLVANGIHVLLKQARDGSVVAGDSHEYRHPWEAFDMEERTTPSINAAIVDYARSLIRLPSWDMGSTWNGYYLVDPTEPVFTADVDDRIHIVTGIGGKGMTTGPGFARHSVATLLQI